MRRPSSWLADDRGAVYVEFLIVFMALATAFFGTLQLGHIGVASIVVKHAAACAARAAIVVLPDDPAFYEGVSVGTLAGRRESDINEAAAAPLLAFSKQPSLEVQVRSPSHPEGGTRVRVQLAYECTVPLARLLFCRKSAGRHWFDLSAEAELPNQGASFEYGTP